MGFWKGKSVLVTGADGFIGSHLTEHLVLKGADVAALVYYNSFAHWGWLDTIEPDMLKSIDIIPGDVRDANRTLEAISGRDVVFHLASLIAIPYSYQAPESYVQTNITGSLNVFNACLKTDVERLIHTSTSEVYGTAQYVPIDEKHPLQGQSPYSATKIAADMLAESFYRSFQLPVSTIRPFNTFGPRQSARAVIPTIISQLYAGAESLKLGTLSPSRDFNYVLDTVSGFLHIAEEESTIGKVINIGSGRDISIGNLVDLILKITGRSVPIVTEELRMRPEKSEVQRLLCDHSLAMQLTGWRPRYKLEEGLEMTAAWIKDNLNRFESDQYQT